MDIRRLIETFLRERQVSPAQFGRWAARDPKLVFDMRRGREFGPRMEARLRAYIADYRPQPQGQRGSPTA